MSTSSPIARVLCGSRGRHELAQPWTSEVRPRTEHGLVHELLPTHKDRAGLDKTLRDNAPLRIVKGAARRHLEVPVEIIPYSPAHHQAVDRLNARLAAAGSEWRFPPRERPPSAEELAVWNESFVAVADGEVCGGYILKHQQFFLEGRPLDVGSLQLPVSLGEVDSEFARVSVALLFDVIRRSPHVYSLGLGSEDTQFARLLAAARWRHVTVPFYFSVKSGNRFARNIRLPADRAVVQSALRVLGHARLAGVALRLRQTLGSPRHRATPAASEQWRQPADFDDFADDLFAANVEAYGLVADRRMSALRRLYPAEDGRFLRLVVEREDRAIGWALVLDTQMSDDKYFGAMRVGSIADCFAAPGDAYAVVSAADEFLSQRGVDIVVSNQLHPQWCQALKIAGYKSGPSNFFFYFSADLAERLDASVDWEQKIHLNRGDGEGPAHL